MRKWLFRVAWLVPLAMIASAEEVGQVYNSDVSVTQANSAVVFTDNGSGGSGATFRAVSILVRSLSTSANTCYLDTKDTVATTADTPLEVGGSIVFDFPATAQPAGGWPGIGAICSTGQTATFRVTAVR